MDESASKHHAVRQKHKNLMKSVDAGISVKDLITPPENVGISNTGASGS